MLTDGPEATVGDILSVDLQGLRNHIALALKAKCSD